MMEVPPLNPPNGFHPQWQESSGPAETAITSIGAIYVAATRQAQHVRILKDRSFIFFSVMDPRGATDDGGRDTTDGGVQLMVTWSFL